jgi:5-(carboxyamino)imidazole ribonucleotide mutase
MSLIRSEDPRAARVLRVCLAFMAMAVAALAQTISTTTVQGTVYLANGSPGSGTLQLSWPAFTTASNMAVAAGKITTSIGADGFVSVNLAPNLGSSPAGLYYTAIYHLSDGTTSTEYWATETAGVSPNSSAAWNATNRTDSTPRDFSPPSAYFSRLSKWPSKHGIGISFFERLLLGSVESPSRSYNFPMSDKPLVGVVMGSKSDFETLSAAVEILRALEIPHEARIVSAHRTPDWLFKYAETARERGLRVIIAGAGGAAHLPGMLASKTLVPVLGVPVPATQLNGLDSLLSIVQMPKGVPVGTLAIGKPGAANAALLAAEILAASDPALYDRLAAWRAARTEEVMTQELP